MGVNALRINMTESPEHKRGSPPTWPTANHLELGGQNVSKGHKTYLSSRRSVRGCGRGSSNAATPAGRRALLDLQPHHVVGGAAHRRSRLLQPLYRRRKRAGRGLWALDICRGV